MKKKLLQGILSMVLAAAVTFSTAMAGYCSTGEAESASVSGNSVKEATGVSQDGIPVTEIMVESDGDGNVLSICGPVEAVGPEAGKPLEAESAHGDQALIKWQQSQNTDCISFTVPDTGTWQFMQTFARTELFDEFQKARMDRRNWWYYTNNLGEPLTKKYVTVDKGYVWDYTLEAAAMQRAFEQMFGYGHTRPDGVSAQEVFYGTEYWDAMNCNELTSAYGKSAAEIVALYMEEDKLCLAKQQHRLAILTDSYYRIGIGCIKSADGTYYTAVEIAEDQYFTGGTIPLAAATPAVDGYRPMELKIAASPTGSSVSQFQLLDRYCNENKELPLKAGETYNIKDKYFGPFEIGTVTGSSPYFSWYSTDESVVTVKDGIITAVGAGRANVQSKGKYFKGIIAIEVTEDSGAGEPVVQPDAPPAPPATQPAGSGTAVLHAQTIEVSTGKMTCKASALKKKGKSFRIGAVVNGGAPHGKVTYKVTKYPKGGRKCVTVNSKGKVTIKKGAKKGTYRVTVTAAGTAYYQKATKTVTIRVR